MKHSSGRPRGRAALAVGIGLMCAAMAAMVVKACQVEPVVTPVPPSGTSPPPLAATPAAAPALPAPSLPDEPRVAPAGPQLAVHNPCDQALLLAVNFGSTRGQRVSVGFFEVRSGARMSIAMTSGEIVIGDPMLYYYTETLQTEPVETGSRHEAVGDRMVDMKRVRLERPERAAIDLECPGATSGRP